MRAKRRDVVEDYLGRAPEAYLACRGLLHPWRRQGRALLSDGGDSVLVRWRCSSCGAEKDTEYARRSGRRVRTRYFPPEGYRLVGAGRVDKSWARISLFERVLEEG